MTEPMSRKVCSKCRESKPVSDYHRKRAAKSGVSARCRECTNAAGRERFDPEANKKYKFARHRTIRGWVVEAIKNMRVNSKERGHPPPDLDNPEDLMLWLLEQNFTPLWDAYVASGFDTFLRPSIDRLSNSSGYLRGNMRLVTWRENWLAYATDPENHARLRNTAKKAGHASALAAIERKEGKS